MLYIFFLLIISYLQVHIIWEINHRGVIQASYGKNISRVSSSHQWQQKCKYWSSPNSSRMLDVSEGYWLKVISIILKGPFPVVGLQFKWIPATKWGIFLKEGWIFIISQRVQIIHGTAFEIWCHLSNISTARVCVQLGQ